MNLPEPPVALAPPARRLWDEVVARCAAAGVAFSAPPTEVVHQGDFPCSGYFLDRPHPVLTVAAGGAPEAWLTVLAHEASHLEQWAENDPTWRALFAWGEEASVVLDAWLSGRRELSDDDRRGVVAAIQNNELDAERRTLARLARHGIPHNDAEYAQKANAYVHFYEWVGVHRRWNPPGRPPYAIEPVWKTAPSVLPPQCPRCPPSLMDAYDAAYPSPSVRPRLR